MRRGCSPPLQFGAGLLLLSALTAGGVWFRAKQDRIRDLRLVTFFHGSAGTPYQYKAKEVIYDYNQVRRALLVRHDYMRSNRENRADLKKLEAELLAGQQWKEPIRHCVVPRSSAGLPSPDALTFYGEYPLSRTEKKENGAVWQLAYDPEYLYFYGGFPDDFIRSEVSEELYRKDVMEIFILPEERYCTYVELVFSPDGRRYCRWVNQTVRGRFELSDYAPESLQWKCLRTKDGWAVSGRIGFRDLPGYLRGNPAKRGETLRLMMLHFDYGKNGMVRRYAPVPFLYDGHNWFGYMKLTLQ